MNLTNKVLAFLFSVTVLSNTLLGGGLLWSDNDLAVWRDRAVNGPYKTAGDAFDPLIPGEWDRIVTNKNSFVASPTADRVSSYTISTVMILDVSFEMITEMISCSVVISKQSVRSSTSFWYYPNLRIMLSLSESKV